MKYYPKEQFYGQKHEQCVGLGSCQYRAAQPLSPPRQLSIGWYCIQTKIGQENTAKRNLERQGFEFYLPLTFTDKRLQKRNGKYEPLFKGYGFLRLSTEEGDWSVIRSTLGVRQLVRFGGLPARVPGALIPSLKQRENEMGIHGEEHEYKKGDSVAVQNKQFLEYAVGIYDKSAGDRVIILMNIIGTETEISLKRGDIRPIS